MSPLLSVMVDMEKNPGQVVLFFVITLGLIAGSWLIVRRVRDYELVFLGLLAAAAAVGYGMLSVGIQARVSGTAASGSAALSSVGLDDGSGILMKIAVVLVLAGVARSLLPAWSEAPSAETPKP